MGFPLVEAEDMPDAAANATPIAFGDFARGYLVVDRTGVRVLRDPYSAKPYVLFYTTKRVGGGVQDFDAIKLMKFGTAKTLLLRPSGGGFSASGAHGRECPLRSGSRKHHQLTRRSEFRLAQRFDSAGLRRERAPRPAFRRLPIRPRLPLAGAVSVQPPVHRTST